MFSVNITTTVLFLADVKACNCVADANSDIERCIIKKIVDAALYLLVFNTKLYSQGAILLPKVSKTVSEYVGYNSTVHYYIFNVEQYYKFPLNYYNDNVVDREGCQI